MADNQQFDFSSVAQDKDFLAAPLDQKIAYIAAHDKDFAAAPPEDQKAYISHLIGVNAQSMEATPTARAITKQPAGQLILRNDVGLPPEASQSAVGNEYNRQSGAFAGAAAGAMLGVVPGNILLRAVTSGIGSGSGSLAGGATPSEAASTGAAATVLQPAGELATAALSTAGKKLLSPLADKAGDFWSSVTGYTKALEEAKNANLARYMAAEQKGAQAVAEGQTNVAAVKASQPQGQLGNWSDLNQSIGVSAAKAVRIGKGFADLSNAYGIPGRGLEAEGFTTQALQKMTPPEQAAAIGPRFQAAGKAVQATADKATEAGAMLDAGKSVSSVIRNRIKDPSLQEKAIEIINSHQQELGISDMRQATPTQALALRQALKNDANFGPNASVDSLKGIGRALYGAVSNDLHDAVPGMKTVDMHYGDLAQAVDSVRSQTGKYMAGKWTPPQTAVQKAEAAVPQLPTSSPYTPLPASHSFTLDALRKLGIGAGLLSGLGGGAALARYAASRAVQQAAP